MHKDGLVPLYEQVRRRIASGIDAGLYPPGGFLPPELELCSELGVSRITLRRAVGELCREGRLIRQQGRGTLVAPRKITQTITLSGFADTMAGLGRKAGHRVLEICETPDPGEAAELGLAALPIRFTRLLQADGAPLTLEQLWFDAGRFPGIAAPVRAGGSFFAALRELYGVIPSGAERQIDVGFTDGTEAALLGVSPTQPVYRIDKTVLEDSGKVLALSHLVTPCHLVTLSFRS